MVPPLNNDSFIDMRSMFTFITPLLGNYAIPGMNGRSVYEEVVVVITYNVHY